MNKKLNLVTVRLSDGGAQNQGRVELNVNGLWGTVADPEWNKEDGDVVCQMLSLPPSSATPGGAIFGQGTGIVWLSHVDCLGNEDSITDCGNSGGWGTARLYSYSEHADDAGVICGEPNGKLSSQRERLTSQDCIGFPTIFSGKHNSKIMVTSIHLYYSF